MKKQNTTNSQSMTAEFKAQVVYGFLERLEVIILGATLKGNIEKGMRAHLRIGQTGREGNWEIVEIQHMDFINDIDGNDFQGLVVRCENVADFNLIKSLRLYHETILID